MLKTSQKWWLTLDLSSNFICTCQADKQQGQAMNYFLIFFFPYFYFSEAISLQLYREEKSTWCCLCCSTTQDRLRSNPFVTGSEKQTNDTSIPMLSKSRTNTLIWKGKRATEEIWKGKEEMTRSRKIHLEERHRKDLDCLMTLEDCQEPRFTRLKVVNGNSNTGLWSLFAFAFLKMY